MHSRYIVSVTNVQITLAFLFLWKEVDRKRATQQFKNVFVLITVIKKKHFGED